MSKNVPTNIGSGGDSVYTEQPGGTGPVFGVTKIHTGAQDVDGGPVAAANPIDVRIGDATNTANVKAASTATAATDKALVVGLHPSSPLPAGTNSVGTVVLGATPNTIASGSITATDAAVGAPAGAGVLLNGTSTAGSFLAVLCPGGDTAWTLQLTGTFGGGTVYFEGSLDSTTGADGNWAALNGRQSGIVNTVLANGTTVAGFFRGNTSGIKYLRVRIVGATAPNVAVIVRLSSGPAALFLNGSIPTGANTIGSVKVTDGTNTQQVATAIPSGAAQPGAVVRPYTSSDGTNTTPTMDAVTRRAFMALTDGTSTAAVKAASTAAIATDPALVVALSPNAPVKIVQQNATATLANVASVATSTAVLAANANRKGATIWNDSTSVLYLNFGGTAAATACTVKMRADDYYEVPFGYTGLINGIWVTAAGSARVTEIT